MRRVLVLSEPLSRAALRLVRELAAGGCVETMDGRHLYRRNGHVRGVSRRAIEQLEALVILRRGLLTEAGHFILGRRP